MKMKTSIFIVFIHCLVVTTLANEDKTLGMSKDNPAASCHEIYQHNPTSRGSVGQYWIKTSEGLFEVMLLA